MSHFGGSCKFNPNAAFAARPHISQESVLYYATKLQAPLRL
jgi:hypothetical protein